MCGFLLGVCCISFLLAFTVVGLAVVVIIVVAVVVIKNCRVVILVKSLNRVFTISSILLSVRKKENTTISIFFYLLNSLKLRIPSFCLEAYDCKNNAEVLKRSRNIFSKNAFTCLWLSNRKENIFKLDIK